MTRAQSGTGNEVAVVSRALSYITARRCQIAPLVPCQGASAVAGGRSTDVSDRVSFSRCPRRGLPATESG